MYNWLFVNIFPLYYLLLQQYKKPDICHADFGSCSLQKWEELAAKDKVRYEAEMEEYRKNPPPPGRFVY